MNKKLLIVAVGAALVAGPMLAAHADVKVYGMLQAELASEDADTALAGTSEEFLRTNTWQGGDIDTDTGGNTGSMLTLEDNQRGRFGIKASEDLGGGLKGLAVVEYDIGSTETSGSGPTIRHASVGLAGDFGTFLVGALKSPYKYTGGVKYDPFVTTNLEARRNGGMTGGLFGSNGFISNVISYQTKGLPVDVWVLYSPDENGADSTGNEGSTVGDKGDYAASVKFGGEGWEAFFSTAHNEDNTGPADSFANNYDANKIGGKYSMGPHTFLVQYEDTDEDVSATATNAGNILFLAYHLKMGINTLVAQFGDGELKQTGDPDKQEHTYLTLGVVHSFSKTTRLFGGYSTTEVDNEGFAAGVNGDRKVYTVGLRKDF